MKDEEIGENKEKNDHVAQLFWCTLAPWQGRESVPERVRLLRLGC